MRAARPASGARGRGADVAAPRPGRLRQLAIALLFAAVALHALWAGATRVPDMDLWWSMAAGRYIVEHGAIPDHDVLSYTHEGVPWFNGEWLSQVLYFELYRLGGGMALALYKLAVLVVAFGLAAWIGWRRSSSLVLAAATAVLAAYCGRGFFDIRAQLFLFVGALALVAILEAYRRGGPVWVLGLLTPVMIVWVNLHYSFLYGVGILLLYAGCEAVKSWLGLPARPMSRQRSLRLVGAVAVAVLATLLNPYHVRALTEPFVILGAEAPWREEITEWLRPELFAGGELNPILFGYLLILQAVAAVVALACDWRRFDLTDALLAAVTGAMALSARRFIPLFALVSAPLLATNLATLRARLPARWSGRGELSTAPRALGASALAVAAVAVLLVRALPEARETFRPGLFEGMIYADYFPQGAVEFLRMNPLPARIFHPYTWGGYINFGDPSRKVFIDGRAHTVYPWSFYQEFQIGQNGKPGWDDMLDRWGVSLIVWPSGIADGVYALSLEQFDGSSRWVRIYDDGHTGIFASVERAQPWIEGFRSVSLAYPDRPGAQLFVGQALIDAKEFARARDQILAVARTSREARDATADAEQGYRRLAASADSADAWFGLGFYREVNGSREGAVEAYRKALSRGLGPRESAYAAEAVGRLAPQG